MPHSLNREDRMQYRPLYCTTIDTPIGHLRLVASDKGLCAVQFDGQSAKAPADMEENPSDPLLQRAEKQLAEYFAGKRKEFDLKLDMRGTIFQLKTWQELRKIPYGQTISYGEQAKRVGNINASRAVGAANGRNPIPVIVPCHRVIGASGHLTGFAGGVPVKEYLLKHEAAQA